MKKDVLRPRVTQLMHMDGFIPQAMSTSYVGREVMARIRERFPEALLLFGGDLVQGTPYFNFFGGDLVGIRQELDYLAGLGLDTGWLVIFDRRGGIPPIAERLTATAETSPDGRPIRVLRL